MDNSSLYQYSFTPSPELPKKRQLGKILLIFGMALLTVGAIVIAIVLANKISEAQQLEEFATSETQLLSDSDEIRSDPIFSVTPYQDVDEKFYIDAWAVDGEITVKIMLSCDEGYQVNLDVAQQWLKRHISSTTGYIVEIDGCSNTLPQ